MALIAMSAIPDDAKLKIKYEVCPKRNETGVINTVLKNIEIYQSHIPSI